jgi:hypothetical protein
MKGALRNIIVKFTQQQLMNEDFQGERVLDAIALQELPGTIPEERFLE